MLDSLQIQNNWPKIRSQILTHWNKLAEADVENTHGSSTSLKVLIGDAYGATDDFEKEYENLCGSIITSKNRSSYSSLQTMDPSTTSIMNSDKTAENDVIENAMDKSRDDMYLLGPNGVTRPTENNKNFTEIQTNNIQRMSSKQIKFLPSQGEDITLGRSNSSANTTSQSAPTSSVNASKDTKKL